MSDYFWVRCCDRRRGVLPGGVLVCSRCDYVHEGASVIPNENRAKDVPARQMRWRVPHA